MSLCSVELQHEVSFVSSDHPLLVEMLVVTFVKEKMEPDRLKVQECDSCFVPLSMICEPCLPCLRHVCKPWINIPVEWKSQPQSWASATFLQSSLL